MRPPPHRGSDTSRTLALGAAVALALVAGAAGTPRPAAAGEARGELSVTVQVVSSCRATFAGRVVTQDCGGAVDAPYPVEEQEGPLSVEVGLGAGTRFVTVVY